MYVSKTQYVSLCSVCADGTVHVSIQCMCRQYGTCQIAVYAQTVWYVSDCSVCADSMVVSDCSVCADSTVHVSIQCMCRRYSTCQHAVCRQYCMCQHAVYVQTVRYMSACSVCVTWPLGHIGGRFCSDAMTCTRGCSYSFMYSL
jgi:hypothetical protein